MLNLIYILLSIVISVVVRAETPKEFQSQQYTICKGLNKVRTIKVVQKNKGCQTLYTKDGSEKLVAAAASLEICRNVLSKIQKNLEENNWGCKDITESRISSY